MPGGALHGQPWAVDVRGIGYAFPSKPQAAAYIVALIAAGLPAVDVGCFQVDLRWHPAAFPTLEAALDPLANARYAARYLTELHGQTADWSAAIARYHSASARLGPPYATLVLARRDKLLAATDRARPQIQIWYGSPLPAGRKQAP